MDEENKDLIEVEPPAEAPQDEQQTPGSGKPKPNMRTHYLIRILVGAYLAYLGWQLLQSYIDKSASSPALAVIAGPAFLLIGIALAVWSAVLMARDDS